MTPNEARKRLRAALAARPGAEPERPEDLAVAAIAASVRGGPEALADVFDAKAAGHAPLSDGWWGFIEQRRLAREGSHVPG